MGRILVYGIRYISYSSDMGRTRPNRRADIPPLRWILQMNKTRHTGDESTIAFWLYMKALYKDDE